MKNRLPFILAVTVIAATSFLAFWLAATTPAPQGPAPSPSSPPLSLTAADTTPEAQAPTPTASSNPAAETVATPVALVTTPATYGHPGTIAPEYFGMHIAYIEPNWTGKLTPWPQVPFGSWRLWDAFVAWPNLEPKRGNWQFQKLDQYAAIAHAHGLNDILYTLALSPTWASSRPNEPYNNNNGTGWAAEPADIQTWRNYVRTVAQRYKGVIKYFEIWNEPNLTEFFSGDVNAMVRLACAAYQEIKAVDRTATVVSPPATIKDIGPQWLDKFLQSGGANCMDVVGFHFYTPDEPPEAMLKVIDQVGAVMLKHGIASKPLWNTETGWVIANARVPLPDWTPADWPVLSDETASAYLVRALALAAYKGVDRFYWFGWDVDYMALVEPDTQQLKRAGTTFGRVQTWLQGTTVSSCSNQTNIWVCELAAPGGGMRHIVWKTDGPQSWTVPTAWQANRAKTLSGKDISLAATGGVVEISPSPIMVSDRPIN